MMTSSNGNIFRVTGLLRGEFTGHRWIPCTKASEAVLRCFFDLRVNQQLSKQWMRRCFEKQSRLLWRQCNSQERRNLIANALELRLSRINPPISYVVRLQSFDIRHYGLITWIHLKGSCNANGATPSVVLGPEYDLYEYQFITGPRKSR